jgi:hypothetical protein
MWLTVRGVILVLGALGASYFVPGPKSPFSGGSVQLLLVFFIFGVVATILVIGLQAINARSARVWTKPAWHANPFSLQQPMQVFHLIGFYCLACGVAAVAVTLMRGLDGLEPLLPFVLGTGILVGLRCCLVLYRAKFRFQ